MDQKKLFNVLVIGGALLGGGCETAAPPPGTDSGGLEPDAAASDGGEVLADGQIVADAASEGDASAPPADAALMDCGFCPNEICCETDESGASVLRDGMECCWGTSC